MIGGLNTEALKAALTTARGDILDVCTMLSCRARDVTEAIRGVPELQALLASIRSQKAENPNWDTQTAEDFEAAIQSRLAIYKAEALEQIRDIAMMDPDGNAELTKVKLAAAIKLYGEGPRQSQGSDIGTVLAELARKYQESAPRLSRLRLDLQVQRDGDDGPTERAVLQLAEERDQLPEPAPHFLVQLWILHS
jgi:hypothetical protein